MIVNEIMI